MCGGLSEGKLGIHKNEIFRLPQKWGIITVKEFVGIGYPVKEVDLIKRQTVITKSGIKRRIFISNPVVVKKREGGVERNSNLFSEIM